jgi:hypothetical protein
MAAADAKFSVPHVDSTLKSGAAGVEPGTKILHFGSFFVGSSKKDKDHRALTLVHEASHAFCKTVDTWDGKTWLPVDPPKEGDKVGCKYLFVETLLHSRAHDDSCR